MCKDGCWKVPEGYQSRGNRRRRKEKKEEESNVIAT